MNKKLSVHRRGKEINFILLYLRELNLILLIWVGEKNTKNNKRNRDKRENTQNPQSTL